MHSIEAAILVDAPVEACYREWLNFERFPEYMRRVERVRKVAPSGLSDKWRERDAEEVRESGRRNIVEPGLRGNRASESDRPELGLADPQKGYADTIAGEVLHEMHVHGDNIWLWTVRGPFNRIYEFTAGLIMNVPNKVITWASMPDQDVPTTGSVNFLKQAGNASTLIEVRMSFSAPNPPFGEIIADLFHYGDNVVNECLEDFKQHMEGDLGVAASGSVMKNEAEVREATGVSPFTP